MPDLPAPDLPAPAVSARDVTAELVGAYAPDPQDLDRLHGRLVRAAESSGAVDVAYRTVDSPVGELLLAATDEGLVRVAYPGEGHDQVLQRLADRISPRILRAPGRLDTAARELDEYFAGRRRSFDLSLDLRLASGFRQTVLRLLRGIGYGRTTSYSAVATAAGNPKAVRAVGTACATNPLPLVVPCHRVLRSDGQLGGYLGGLAVKQALLRMESEGLAHVPRPWT
jgi:methylated-DNA-[protein]-cysteine S-methyltransferase